MEISEYEDLIREQITSVIKAIISKNETLSISAKSRAGAEISDWLRRPL